MLIEELSIDQIVLKAFIWTWNNEKWKLPAKDLMTVETILMNDYFVFAKNYVSNCVQRQTIFLDSMIKSNNEITWPMLKLLNYCLSGNKWVEGQLFSDKRGYTIDNRVPYGKFSKNPGKPESFKQTHFLLWAVYCFFTLNATLNLLQ